MKPTKLTLLAIGAMIIAAACGSSKKIVTPAVPSTPVVAAPPVTPLLFLKPANGIYAPGDEELAAIQVQDSTVTLDQLKEGYTIYAQGACIKCHEAQNIYRYNETQWKGIVDNMALKAMMPLAQKEAVYKYVLAIKAVKATEEAK
ncbi:MAG: hypothetical protein V4658_03480 [Bacteroidota bacterium]